MGYKKPANQTAGWPFLWRQPQKGAGELSTQSSLGPVFKIVHVTYVHKALL